MSHTWSLALRAGLLTVAFLIGGLLLGIAAGSLVAGAPMATPDSVRQLIAAIPALLIFTGTSAGWGWSMARLTGAPGAAERATMITVMATGNVAAALVAGGALGVAGGAGPSVAVRSGSADR
jgi:hypothetical protein